MAKYCKCGCGGVVKTPDRWGRNRYWLNGHANRVFRETRMCICGCGGTFECKVSSKQEYIYNHHQKGKTKSELCKSRMKGRRLSPEHIAKLKAHKKTEIHRENLSKSHKGKKVTSGSDHYNWKGGISTAPYPSNFTKGLREVVRVRDNYTCQICGEKQGKRRLTIHHIDYDKKNCDEKNLIAVCIRHNCMMNFNREIWMVHVQEIQERRYKWTGEERNRLQEEALKNG